ncbi:NitT/TauT family transport system permease protein [Sporobacter termitidis DSM 10068]|uniref:NitT/TauT family transport system permease protein n=1 Tax=Sporobacter termitidis DSM 10068 TaxID=1123282 RepID=A0A1M5XFE7_9FIRM|nr:ABC transporter permease [Sporobacter termitidis]SHH98469.1 NitT/TauT family transport system permease protein [Sporobacter termitidis DSM 10068]
MKSKIKRATIAIIPLLAFFVLWEVGAYYAPRGVLPQPTKIVVAMLHAFVDPKEQLLFQTLESFKRIGLGFLLAGVVGNVLGFLLGTYFRSLERLFIPFFKVCEKINPFAIIPIFMILFGIGMQEKVAIVFWACIWPILTTTQEAAKNVDLKLIAATRAMGASRAKIFISVIFPYTLPDIFTGLKIAIRVAFFMIVAAETIGASSGLGWYYIRKQAMYNLNLIYGSILYITVLAILFNFLFTRLEKKFLVWKEAAFN